MQVVISFNNNNSCYIWWQSVYSNIQSTSLKKKTLLVHQTIEAIQCSGSKVFTNGIFSQKTMTTASFNWLQANSTYGTELLAVDSGQHWGLENFLDQSQWTGLGVPLMELMTMFMTKVSLQIGGHLQWSKTSSSSDNSISKSKTFWCNYSGCPFQYGHICTGQFLCPLKRV